ncbi:hypothetical protein N7495_006841 [Penicillium taxi]|uniref:uncharacterized protein n=1 Tax=Penicillium taxi TaxID=168475 RepID=UPI002545183B|nr:uncharacterized protein N7495_006841 [Penicillium taxi]KAJ5895150.1 hypothetical protein N7495_006841 [Penicillium taxi]
MDQSPMQHLPDELLSDILSFLLDSRPQALDIGGRNGLEAESQTIRLGEASDLDRFRLVCKRFMRIGTPRQFSRFNLRFSEHGFRRLGDLLEMQLACYVKSVTYLVRPFYQGSGWMPMLRTLGFEDPTLAQVHIRRFREQTRLVENNRDLVQLRKAMEAFSSLQEIKLLRLQDKADDDLLDFIRDHSIRRAEGTSLRTTRFDWESACSRAVTNLGISILGSQQCTSIRFIGPQISPEATLQLLRAPPTTFTAIGSRLTSLDINFHSHTDITATMSDLSGVFRRVFTEAQNLVTIKIGFPPKSPLNLALEAIFHNISWKTLRTLGLKGWRLHAEEIISLARRHRSQLRDLRLNAVYVRPGGRWIDVLSVLRVEMKQLNHLDLTDIDYSGNFDAVFLTSGVEVFDDPLSITPISSSLSNATSAFPPQPDLLDKVRDLATVDLGDNGLHVHRDQGHLWEAWVLSGLRMQDVHSNSSVMNEER